MSGIDGGDYLSQAQQIGQELRDSGVEYGGEVGEDQLGSLEAPDTPSVDEADGAEDEFGEQLYQESDADYLAEAREVGGDLDGAGVEYVGPADEADLGTMSPPDTPDPAQGPEQST